MVVKSMASVIIVSGSKPQIFHLSNVPLAKLHNFSKPTASSTKWELQYLILMALVKIYGTA